MGPRKSNGHFPIFFILAVLREIMFGRDGWKGIQLWGVKRDERDWKVGLFDIDERELKRD